MGDYKPIDCNLYDYVEIACLYQYEVQVTTIDGQTLVGTAVDTRSDPDQNEFLVMRSPGRELLIRLDAVTTFTALTEGARFEEVRFR